MAMMWRNSVACRHHLLHPVFTLGAKSGLQQNVTVHEMRDNLAVEFAHQPINIVCGPFYSSPTARKR